MKSKQFYFLYGSLLFSKEIIKSRTTDESKDLETGSIGDEDISDPLDSKNGLVPASNGVEEKPNSNSLKIVVKSIKIQELHHSYKCGNCDYISKRSIYINEQNKTGSLINLNTCIKCEERKITSDTVLKDDRPKKIFICKQCGYRDDDKRNFSEHKKIHTRVRPYKCKQCDFKTTAQNYLTTHMKIHTDKRPYKCSQCGYKTNILSCLRRHLKIHTNEKPFVCDQCDYRTCENSNLVKHMRTHTVGKPFTCDQCDYRTSLKSCLKKHLKSHTGVKPYLCNQCGFKSAVHSALAKHMKIHRDDRIRSAAIVIIEQSSEIT